MRLDALESHGHLRNSVPNFGVIGHRPRQSNRGLILDSPDNDIERLARQSVIEVPESRQRPGEDP